MSRRPNCQNVFLRTNHGDEIDLIIDHRNKIELIEIKASETYHPGFHKTLEKFDLASATKNVIFQGKTMNAIENITAWNYSDFLSKTDDGI